MKKWLLIFLPFFAWGQTITVYPLADVSPAGIQVEVEHYIPAQTTGQISQLTNNIPTDRGTTSNVIFNTANSDQGTVGITFPTGYGFIVGSTTYTTATFHANAWMAFPSTTYNSYPSNQSQPNVPTIHFTSVNNSSTDNNMSHVSWETYTDATYGGVYRLRYEGSYKYNVQGINTKIDLYFFKNDWTKCLIVLRTFLADGSNQEQIGLSNGSTWLASNIISSTTYSSGQAWEIQSAATSGAWSSQGTKVMDATGKSTFSNPNSYQYRVTLTSPFYPADSADANYFASRILQPDSIIGFDWYCLDINNSQSIDCGDLNSFYFGMQLNALPVGAFFPTDEYNIIVNSLTDLRGTYPASSTRTVESKDTYYMPVITKAPDNYQQTNTIE